MSSDLVVIRYEPSGRAAWDSVVRGARARHFLFERDYMDYHADRFDDASWLVAVADRPIAVLPASRHDDEVISHGGLTFGGLLSLPGLTTVRAAAALEAMASAMRADGVRRLIYKPVPHIYHLAPAEEDLYALTAAGACLMTREITAAVAPGERPAYSTERRRAVRKSIASRVELAESGAIEPFWDLLAATLAERHAVAPVHSAAELRFLHGRFPGRIRLFTATVAGELAAGTLIYQTPVVAHAQYIAASPRGRELGALDALFDHLLSQVYPGLWFDFGISNERDGSLNEGLMRNKEGYGARAVVQDRYVLELA